MFVTNIEASNGTATNIKRIQNISFKGSKVTHRSELVNKCNNYSRTNKGLVNRCDDWITLSVQIADDMIAACNYAESSQACINAQSTVAFTMDKTLEICAVAGPTAMLLERPSLDRPKRLKGIKV
jgi:hypothetical protein